MSTSTTENRTAFDTNYSPTTDSTLLLPQSLNSAVHDLVLLFNIMQLSLELVSRDAAHSAAITSVSDGLNRLEPSRSDQSDRDSANLQSVPLPFQPSTVVVNSRESRRDRVHKPPADAVLDQIRYCKLLPVTSANRSRKSD